MSDESNPNTQTDRIRRQPWHLQLMAGKGGILEEVIRPLIDGTIAEFDGNFESSADFHRGFNAYISNHFNRNIEVSTTQFQEWLKDLGYKVKHTGFQVESAA